MTAQTPRQTAQIPTDIEIPWRFRVFDRHLVDPRYRITDDQLDKLWRALRRQGRVSPVGVHIGWSWQVLSIVVLPPEGVLTC